MTCKSLKFKSHQDFYINLFGIQSTHLHSAAFSKAVESHETQVKQELTEFRFKLLEASQKIDNKEAVFSLKYGAGRRLSMISHAYNNIRNTLPPSRTEPLQHEEVLDFDRDLNIIYVNMRGLLDNYLWGLLYELNTPFAELCARQPQLVDIFNKKTLRNGLGESILSKLTEYDSWGVDIKSRRDPVAHRIPLYMPPTILSPEQAAKYKELEDGHFKALLSSDFNLSEQLYNQKENLGQCYPYFLHHPEKEITAIYPTVPEDIGNLISIGNIVIDCVLKKDQKIDIEFNQNKKDQLLRKIGDFKHHWDLDLNVRLENAENLLRHPEGKNNKNTLLHHLVSTYVNSTISFALMSVYELTELLKIADTSYGDKMPSEVHRLRLMRNKLVTHKEENLMDEKWIKFAEEIQKNDWDIFGEIRKGVRLLIEKIETLSPPNLGYSAIEIPKMSEDDIFNLIKKLN